MLHITYGMDGLARLASLDDMYKGATAILMGGAPSIKTQPLHLLEERGVLSCAINNAALHFKPALWFCADPPECFCPTIMRDPRILKFMQDAWSARTTPDGVPLRELPNMVFYRVAHDRPPHQFLDDTTDVPYNRSSLMAALHILYRLGVRRIILGGSDFEVGDKAYAHGDNLGAREKDLNRLLYSQLADELVRLRPVFEAKGLTLMDCSVKSKLGHAYEVVSMERAVELARGDYPEPVDTSKLPHSSETIKREKAPKTARWKAD